MKTKILALAMTLAMVFTFGNTYADKHEKKTVVFKVNMHCSSCKAKVEKNLPFEKGVRDLKVDMKTQTVKIVYKADKNTEKNLIKAIEKCGVKVLGKACDHKHEKCDHKHEKGHKHEAAKCTGDCGSCKSKSCETEKKKTEEHKGCGGHCQK